MEQSPVSIVITNTAGRIEYVNPKFTQVTGYSAAEVLGENPRILKSGEKPQEEYQRLWNTITAGDEWRGEFHNKRKNGELYWESALISPVKDAAGAITHFLAVKEDITERKRIEAALREALADTQQRQREIATLLEAARVVLEMQEFKDTAHAIFDYCKGLIGATAGYVALLTEDGANNKILFLDPGGLPCRADPNLPMPTRGLREVAYRTGRAVYCNDFPRSEGAKFMPPQHVALANVLFAPLVVQGKPVGLLGLANKPGGFIDNDAAIVTAFGELAAVALQRSWNLESLKDSVERFHALAQSAHDAIISVNSQGNIVFWNRAAENMFGYSTAEILQKPLIVLMPERFREGHPHSIRQVIQTGQARILGKTVELVGLRKDGREFPLELSLSMWRAKGEAFFTGIVRDISERKQAEIALRQAHDQLEQRVRERTAELAQANEVLRKEIAERQRVELDLREKEANLSDAQRIANLGNWEWNVQTGQVRWSDQVYRIFGLQPDQINLTYEIVLARIHPADRKPVEAALADALAGKKPCNLDHRIVRPDGAERIVHLETELSYDDQGRPLWMIGTVQDITEKKRLEIQLLRAQRTETIGRLAAGVAHDLNNILAPILMAANMLRESWQDEVSQRLLDTVESSAQRGAGVVKQLLTFARGVEGQKVALQPSHLIKEMAKLIQETFPKSIAVELDYPRDLWLVTGDTTKLHQVLLNLCVNARDAMPQGGSLSLRAENVHVDEALAQQIPDANAGDYVLLSVTDTGTGIPPEILDKIFDPFFTTKGPDKGTGLGLSTVQGIVKSHEGFLQVVSQVGQGTQFKVYLPAALEFQPAPTEVEERDWLRGQGQLILVVEDEAMVRNLFKQTLEKYGYRVITACEGAEAIALYAQHKAEIKLVLTDLAMPIMDGTTTIRILKRMNPQACLIATSGAGSSADLAGVESLGVTAFLRKPFTTASLLQMVHETLTGAMSTES
jgi:PAS domain S-box-containing protein